MKRLKFNELFLLASFIAFISTGRNKFGSVILMLASLNMLLDVIPRLWKEIKQCR